LNRTRSTCQPCGRTIGTASPRASCLLVSLAVSSYSNSNAGFYFSITLLACPSSCSSSRPAAHVRRTWMDLSKPAMHEDRGLVQRPPELQPARNPVGKQAVLPVGKPLQSRFPNREHEFEAKGPPSLVQQGFLLPVGKPL